MHTDKKICVVGLGYIGLPTAALLANRSYHVHGVDVVQSTVDTINRGEIHIVEPELDTFVRSAVNSGKLVADTKPVEADIFIIAVPTPFHEGYVPNIDYVVSATKSIAPYIKEGDIVILESTSPVGTTDKVEEVLAEMRPELFPSLNTQRLTLNTQKSKIFVAHCPERVLPGHIMRELVENDRIVGGITPEATKATAEFYKTFVDGEVLETNAKTAEMAKLTENSFRDTNIAFANELSILCDKFDIDVWELIALANRHPRVNILQPGAGVGGHCIAVDPWFIVHAGGEDAKMIRTAREVNTYKTEWAIEKIKNAALEWKSRRVDEKMSGGENASIHSPVDPSTHIPIHSHAHSREPKIAIFGLAFKPDIDDLRESPALYISKRLTAELENVVCVEPNIPLDYFTNHESPVTNHPKLVELEEALQADVITFLVAHREFKDLEIETDLDFCGVNK
ncbi:MAG: UDP-N-acetyl-D-mannosamine dehydrogenase [Sulfurovum sp.]|nr:UDP-N-acetyl-D-mannosamine dehydrogenase [Sulfurovum sp.]